jgi:hypothetical protein
MADLLARRALGMPVGFWLVVSLVVATGVASALGLSDTVVFFLVVTLGVGTAVAVGLQESRGGH